MLQESLRASNMTMWKVSKSLTIIGLPLKVLTSSLRYLYAWNMCWIIIMKYSYNSYICARAFLFTHYCSTMQTKQIILTLIIKKLSTPVNTRFALFWAFEISRIESMTLPWSFRVFHDLCPWPMLSIHSQSVLRTIYFSRYFATLWHIKCKLVIIFYWN